MLYVPSHFCNVLGRPLSTIYQISLRGSTHEGGLSSRGGLALHGIQIAYFQRGPPGLFSLAVLPPTGMVLRPSVFQSGFDRVVSAHWPHEERVRWETVQARAGLEHDPPRLEPPYALQETEYVNRCWGTESGFLALNRLELDDRRDRSEGRRIVRALMKGRDPKEKIEEEVEVEGKVGDHLLPDRGKARHFRHKSAPRMPLLPQGW